MNLKKIFFVSLLGISLNFSLHSQETSVQDYYSYILRSHQEQDWISLLNICEILIDEYPNTPFSEEALYYLGVGYYELNDYTMANNTFSEYLKKSDSPKFFESAIKYKFFIAESYRNGAHRRMFHLKKSPKIASAKEDAIEIYDEVISSLPYHDLTARSLFGKGIVQRDLEDFRDSIETFQSLIKRFPKHECSIDAFMEIGQTYLAQCNIKNLNPEIIALAELNLSKFKMAFPSEEKISELEKVLVQIKEIFAKSLYETGKFFERRKQKDAAIIYYAKVLTVFPETPTAQLCEERLKNLQS
ncbi:MAG: outer membrane protein assembly factor BamD [Chlamydiota bacterium]|jgi:outer membrane protein assembly factor BamD (BamD/ComL family)